VLVPSRSSLIHLEMHQALSSRIIKRNKSHFNMERVQLYRPE
jgi:hypothetical protein